MIFSSETPALSLYELNCIVRDTLSLTLTDSFWITAEIAELRQAYNGHCYMELVDKDDTASGTFRAKARANVWKTTWEPLRRKFERASGRPLSADMKVLLQVSVSFHEVYGFSLTVLDIDPSYTLGEMARRRKEILARLEEDGVLTLNKELELPRIARRIAVVSSETAAGYGDFCNQITQSGYNFRLKLFPATMQGKTVSDCIIGALDGIARNADRWDCVVIIRGGGATTDLDGFENYDLAANVAQFPLPVITGIGHERDDTVIDFVACVRCKTPTAVAAFLIDRMADEEKQLRDAFRAITESARSVLAHRRQQFERAAHRYSLAATNFVTAQQLLLRKLTSRLNISAERCLQETHRRLETSYDRIGNSARQRCERENHRLLLAQKSLTLADPARLLGMGYSITFGPDGKVLKSAESITAGDLLETQFADGTLKSRALPHE